MEELKNYIPYEHDSEDGRWACHCVTTLTGLARCPDQHHAALHHISWLDPMVDSPPREPRKKKLALHAPIAMTALPERNFTLYCTIKIRYITTLVRTNVNPQSSRRDGDARVTDDFVLVWSADRRRTLSTRRR